MTIVDQLGEVSLRNARSEDVRAIAGLFRANRSDVSLFQQSEPQIRRNLSDFVLAEDREAAVLGCIALHWHSAVIAEILGLTVDPDRQRRGVGTLLTEKCISLALAGNADILWLATAKPDFFARLGFTELSKWQLPLSVLFIKFCLVFQQPLSRWLPAILGRHTFMKFDPRTCDEYAA